MKTNIAALTVINTYKEQERNKGGHPRIFDSPEDLEGLFMAYLNYCDAMKKMPNIAGFCTYMRNECGRKINRDTYYAYKTYEGFPDTIKAIDMALEDAVLNAHQYNALIRMAYLNNKCGYANKQEVIPDAPDSRTPQQLITDYEADLAKYKKLLGK